MKGKGKVANYSASCDGVQVDSDGGLYALVVYSNGEGFNSFVYHLTDVASRNAPNQQNELLNVDLCLTDIRREGNGELFCSDNHGSIHRFQGGSWAADPVSSKALTCVWSLPSGALLSAGEEGVVFRNEGSGWRPISPALGDNIFSIRGASESDLYVCGEGGLFWRFDGTAWTKIPLPTKERLLGILAVSPDEVYVCGRGGALFRGAGETWEDLSFSGHDFHGIEACAGQVVLAGAKEGIFQLDGADLVNIKNNISSYKLASHEGYLASCGDNLAARREGESWFGSRFS